MEWYPKRQWGFDELEREQWAPYSGSPRLFNRPVRVMCHRIWVPIHLGLSYLILKRLKILFLSRIQGISENIYRKHPCHFSRFYLRPWTNLPQPSPISFVSWHVIHHNLSSYTLWVQFEPVNNNKDYKYYYNFALWEWRLAHYVKTEPWH